jgi:hypothetical protein
MQCNVGRIECFSAALSCEITKNNNLGLWENDFRPAKGDLNGPEANHV